MKFWRNKAPEVIGLQTVAGLVLTVCAGAACVEIGRLARALREETEVRTEVTRQLPDLVRAELAQTRAAAIQEIETTRHELRQELRITRQQALVAVNTMTERLDRRLEMASAQLNPLIEDSRSLVQESQAAISVYSKLPDRLAYANRWLWDCENYSGCLQSQTLALVGSARYTMGQVAKAAPGMVSSMDRLADSSGRAAENLAASSANLATITQPGPKWLRKIGFAASLAVPFAQTTTPFILWKLNSGQQPTAGSR